MKMKWWKKLLTSELTFFPCGHSEEVNAGEWGWKMYAKGFRFLVVVGGRGCRGAVLWWGGVVDTV